MVLREEGTRREGGWRDIVGGKGSGFKEGVWHWERQREL